MDGQMNVQMDVHKDKEIYSSYFEAASYLTYQQTWFKYTREFELVRMVCRYICAYSPVGITKNTEEVTFMNSCIK